MLAGSPPVGSGGGRLDDVAKPLELRRKHHLDGDRPVGAELSVAAPLGLRRELTGDLVRPIGGGAPEDPNAGGRGGPSQPISDRVSFRGSQRPAPRAAARATDRCRRAAWSRPRSRSAP